MHTRHTSLLLRDEQRRIYERLQLVGIGAAQFYLNRRERPLAAAMGMKAAFLLE